jgi:hypothetical protein
LEFILGGLADTDTEVSGLGTDVSMNEQAIPQISVAPLIKRPGEPDPGLNAYEFSLP